MSMLSKYVLRVPSIMLATIVALVANGASIKAAADSAARKPNILIIVGDDMGYSDLGCQGGKDIPTPHLDALAASGVRCTNGYVSGPYCSPTRAGLLTGRYQQRFGHEFNPGPLPTEDVGLPLTETTLAQRLQNAGYKTGLVGKWHLGAEKKFQPQQRGFQEFFGFLGGAHSYFNAAAGPRMNTILRGSEPVAEKEYLTDAFAREGLAFVDRHAQEPWFLYWAFNAVHTPLQATEERLAKFAAITDPKRRNYAAMMIAMDDAVGAMLKKLRDEKLEENTLIFFVSDNGGPTAANGSNNKPLRGFKAETWEGGVRVPLFVSWKGKIPAGKTYDQPVIQLDFHPTALAAAGVEAKADWKLDGVNLLPYLNGDKTTAPHDALYWRFGPQKAIRVGNYKLVQGRGSDKVELFDLAQDIGEATDLAATKPEIFKDLSDKWAAWDKTLEAPRWSPNAGLAGKKKGKKKAE